MCELVYCVFMHEAWGTPMLVNIFSDEDSALDRVVELQNQNPDDDFFMEEWLIND